MARRSARRSAGAIFGTRPASIVLTRISATIGGPRLSESRTRS